jgi:GNAT superfamily N-acetyltransferase
MDDRTLAVLEHQNMIETMAAGMANAPGSLVRREAGVALYASGLPVRFFNQVTIEDDRATPDRIAASVATVRERGAPFVVHLRRGIDDPFRPLMTELGLVLPAGNAAMPGMALDPIPPATTPIHAGHVIRLVDDEAGMHDHIRTGALGFGMPEDLLRAIVAMDTWQRPGNAVYVGYTDGEPVTTGLGVRTGPTIGLYNIATVEHARRRGLGAAMTERIAVDGVAEGCAVAVLQASAMGQPVYRRLGYRTVVEYDGWIDADDAAAPPDPA